MEAVLPPPSPFCYTNNLDNVVSGNLSEEWKKWKNAFIVYYEACELSKRSDKTQINTFLHLIGEQCREIYNQFDESSLKLEKLLEKFDNFFKEKKNITVLRHRFFTREQEEGESVEQYADELKKMAVNCEFNNPCEDLIRDRIICGIKENSLRERLLREPYLTLQKTLHICNLALMSKIQAGNIKMNYKHYEDKEGDALWTSRRQRDAGAEIGWKSNKKKSL